MFSLFQFFWYHSWWISISFKLLINLEYDSFFAFDLCKKMYLLTLGREWVGVGREERVSDSMLSLEPDAGVHP